MSNEKDIRELVKEFLLNTYKGSVIKEEFGVFLDSRNDVMSIDDSNIVSVEIKSDRDTFVRLEKQLNTYRVFSTSIYVALDICHYEKYKSKFKDKYNHVGILVYENNSLHVKYKPKKDKIPLLYGLLKSNELPFFFMHFKGKSIIPKNEETSKFLIEDIFTKEEIRSISETIFINRFKGREGFFKGLIKRFESKQKVFVEWVKKENWNMHRPTSFVKGRLTKGKPKRSSLKVFKKN